MTAPAISAARANAVPAEPATPARQEAASEARSLVGNPPLTVVVEESVEGIEKHLAAWEQLAAAALEPNVFYESWMLLPALRHLRGRAELRFLFIYAPPAQTDAPPVLCGFFPLERVDHYKNLPVSALRLWKHVHCFLASPLVRPETAAPCFKAVFEWAATDARGSALIEFGDIGGDGPLWQAFVEFLEDRKEPFLTLECATRAVLRPRASAAAYLEEALSVKRRRTLRQQENGLKRLGAVDYCILAGDGDLASWTSDFLRLEASGWKAREGTALACNDAEREFFLACMEEAFRRGRLMMLALRLDGKPIAQLCNFICRDGSFAFKVAFDEADARYSPGVLLELENIAEVHRHGWLRWMDSCAASGPSLTKQIWLDRRIIHTVLVASGRSPGPFLLAVLPFMQWVYRHIKTTARRRRQ